MCVFASSTDSDRETVMEFLRHDELSAKVTLIVVYSDFYDVVFPANILKNIVISSVFTTHYIMIEDTMVPSGISP